MALSKSEREAKLQRLAELEGFDTVDAMFDAAVSDSVCPGICVNPGCDYTTEVEPDQRKGYCEICGTQTVKSCLDLVHRSRQKIHSSLAARDTLPRFPRCQGTDRVNLLNASVH